MISSQGTIQAARGADSVNLFLPLTSLGSHIGRELGDTAPVDPDRLGASNVY